MDKYSLHMLVQNKRMYDMNRFLLGNQIHNTVYLKESREYFSAIIIITRHKLN